MLLVERDGGDVLTGAPFVADARIITGLVPCNVIPDEILTDHPDRLRAMIVESTNPAHSLADSRRILCSWRMSPDGTRVVLRHPLPDTARGGTALS